MKALGSSPARTWPQDRGKAIPAPGAHGPGGHRRGHAAVAQIVDEDLPAPRLLGQGGGEPVGLGAAHLFRDRLGEGLALVPFDAAAAVGTDRHDDMQPLAPRRLDEGMQASFFQLGLDRLGGGDDRREIQTLVGIEVEGDLLRRLGIARSTAPGVQFQSARLGHGDQAADIGHGHIGMARLHIDQLEARIGPRHGVTLEEGLALDPVRRPDDGDRPVRDMGQYPLRRRLVVARQIPLGDGGATLVRRPQDLVGMGQGDAGDDHLARGAA